MANKNVSKVVGVNELLSVEVEGHACQISFIIMDHEDHDALLGLDWFNETGACLCLATKTLAFPSEKIILMSEGNEVEPSYDEKEMVITDSEGDEITNDIDWEEERKNEPEPVEKLTKEQEVKFKACMQPIKKLFAHNTNDIRGCNVSKNKIRIQVVPPIYSPPCTVTKKMYFFFKYQ